MFPDGHLDAWKNVLGGPHVDDRALIQRLDTVGSGLTRLEYQLNASKYLREPGKSAALATVANYRVMFELSNFGKPANTYSGLCSKGICGQLHLLGGRLDQEFSEPTLEQPDADTIIAALQSVKDQLEDSTLPLDLVASLRKQIDMLLWWLNNRELISIQDMFEWVASALVVAKQMEQRDPESKNGKPTATKTIIARLGIVAETFGSRLGMMFRGIEAADRLVDDGQQALEHISTTLS